MPRNPPARPPIRSPLSRSIPARARIPVRARAAAPPATWVARARIPARARVAAPPTVPRSNCRGFSNASVSGARVWYSRPCFFLLSHACQPVQRTLGIRDRDRPADSALPAHLRTKAGGGLVRDHLGKLHDRWRTAPGGARKNTGAVQGGAARRLH